MCSARAVLVVLLIVMLWLLATRSEHIENIPINKMTDTDIDKLRLSIERAARVGQFYGDYRRMYPYIVTPWQYFTMIAYRKRGELDNTAVKDILKQSGEVVTA
jgi:hypothetical protein